MYFIQYIICFSIIINVNSIQIENVFQTSLNQQSFHSILQSIEDRLKTLDEIYSVRYSTRVESKLENLNSKLNRLEILLDTKLVKIDENYKTINMKIDFLKDQFVKNSDSTYEKVNNRLSYIETKTEINFIKVQTRMENIQNNLDRLENSMTTRQTDMENELLDTIQGIDDLKISLHSIEHNIRNKSKNTNHDLQNISAIQHNLNHSLLELNKFCVNSTVDQMEFIIQENSKRIITKISTTHDDLIKRSSHIDNNIRDSMALMNTSRREQQDSLRTILSHLNRKLSNINPAPHDNNFEVLIDNLAVLIQKKFSEMNRKIDGHYQNMMLAQNLFLESCHRIQLNEPQLETKLIVILEKLLSSISNNSNTFREIQILQNLLHIHDTKIFDTVGYTKKVIIELAEKSYKYKEEILETILDIKSHLETWLISINNLVNNSHNISTFKMDSLNIILQDLQDYIYDFENKYTEDVLVNISKTNTDEIIKDIFFVLKEHVLKIKNTSVIYDINLHIQRLENFLIVVHGFLTTIENKLNKIENIQHFNNTTKGYLEKLWNHFLLHVISNTDTNNTDSIDTNIYNNKSTKLINSNSDKEIERIIKNIFYKNNSNSKEILSNNIIKPYIDGIISDTSSNVTTLQKLKDLIQQNNQEIVNDTDYMNNTMTVTKNYLQHTIEPPQINSEQNLNSNDKIVSSKKISDQINPLTQSTNDKKSDTNVDLRKKTSLESLDYEQTDDYYEYK